MTHDVVYLNPRLAEALIREGRWHELALRRYGFTTERLMHLARKVAADGCRKRGAVLGDRFDDLVSRLQQAGLQAALRYDPLREHRGYGQNGGDPFTSYVADVMDKRIDDHFRSRSEGFSDRRYGNYGEVTPTDQMEQQRADIEDAVAQLDSSANAEWYGQAAEAEGLSLADWVVRALNARASQTVDRPTRTKSENRKTAGGETYWPGAQAVNA